MVGLLFFSISSSWTTDFYPFSCIFLNLYFQITCLYCYFSIAIFAVMIGSLWLEVEIQHSYMLHVCVPSSTSKYDYSSKVKFVLIMHIIL